jgi:ketosteroid isomerase-like protein
VSAPTSAEQQVLAAAAELVDAFGSHDTERYFGCFVAQASFVFHDCPQVLTSRAAYRELWQTWEQDGFRVSACRSLEPTVQLLTDDTAVFLHRVRTTVAGQVDASRERETIVFRLADDGTWRAVHEHLSPDPATDESDPR